MHGDSGLLVPPRAEQPLAAALGELLAERNLAARLGQGALERMRRFTREQMIEGICGVYGEIARPARAEPALLRARKGRSLQGHD